MSKKIAMLFPYAPSYREAIYKLMDEQLDIDWFFCGNAHRHLKFMDYSLLKYCNLSMEEKRLFGPIRYYKGIRKLELYRYDVIICPGVIRSLSEWWLLWRIGRGMKKTSIFLWTHGWYGRESFVQKVLKKIFFKKVDGFFLYGDYAKNLMINERFEKDKLHVIKNSLDYEKQLSIRNNISISDIYKNYFKNEYPTIIFIGRLTEEKKLDYLIKAIAVLKDRGENCNVVLVGNGVMYEALQTEVTRFGLENRFWFYGESFDEKKNAELIYNADMCVSPGNIGLTAIHTLMFGCPALSHSCYEKQGPEFEAIIPGYTGDFFEYGNVDDLARCISHWLSGSAEKRELIREACYAEVDKYWNPRYQIDVIKSVLEIQ